MDKLVWHGLDGARARQAGRVVSGRYEVGHVDSGQDVGAAGQDVGHICPASPAAVGKAVSQLVDYHQVRARSHDGGHVHLGKVMAPIVHVTWADHLQVAHLSNGLRAVVMLDPADDDLFAGRRPGAGLRSTWRRFCRPLERCQGTSSAGPSLPFVPLTSAPSIALAETAETTSQAPAIAISTRNATSTRNRVPRPGVALIPVAPCFRRGKSSLRECTHEEAPMPEMTRYEHGVPSWVDIGTPDPQAALAFYASLFGWQGQDMGEEAGHYTIVSKDGKQVAAISPAQDSGPPRWTTYINVDDVDSVTKNAESAGGAIIVAPMDVMNAGRMAIYRDTTGAFIAAWQPADHIGAQLVNEPGALTWNELSTSDLAKSKAFYSETFGWGWGGSDEYAEVAGIRSDCRRRHASSPRYAVRRPRPLAGLFRQRRRRWRRQEGGRTRWKRRRRPHGHPRDGPFRCPAGPSRRGVRHLQGIGRLRGLAPRVSSAVRASAAVSSAAGSASSRSSGIGWPLKTDSP